MISFPCSLGSVNTEASEKRNGISVRDDMRCVLGLTGGLKYRSRATLKRASRIRVKDHGPGSDGTNCEYLVKALLTPSNCLRSQLQFHQRQNSS